MSKSLCWKVGNGVSIQVGINPIFGLDKSYSLSQSLVEYLQDFGLKNLNQVRIRCDFPTIGLYWFSTKDLDLFGDWYYERERYIYLLYLHRGLQLTEVEDRLVWSFNAASS